MSNRNLLDIFTVTQWPNEIGLLKERGDFTCKQEFGSDFGRQRQDKDKRGRLRLNDVGLADREEHLFGWEEVLFELANSSQRAWLGAIYQTIGKRL